MYGGNPEKIDFGSSWRGFELSGVNCTRKIANKLMNDTSREINLQSKQDIICHVAKVKLATSDYMADVIPFCMASVIFPSNLTLR